MTEPTPSTSAAPDGYSAGEAARLLGVSPRRVRQLLAGGTLTPAPWSGERPEGAPVILDRESVHKEREARKASRKDTGKTPGSDGAGVDVSDLLDVFERMQERTLETLRAERTEVLAIRDRTEEDLRNALAAERVAREMAERETARVAGEADELRAEAGRLRAKVEELTAAPVPEPERRRKWWQG